MARLYSIGAEMQLSLTMTGRSFDPFQKDLEWFEYELRGEPTSWPPIGISDAGPPPVRVTRGKLSRKDLNEFLRDLASLIELDEPLRFEPYDLNFYLEWSRETPLVYLIVLWFDLALEPRTLERRFPAAHAGFRFLADRDSLLAFRREVEQEFLGSTAVAAPPPRRVN